MSKVTAVRDWLALLVLLGGGYLLAVGDQDLRLVVASMLTMVLSFYFGSSSGSKEKDGILEKMQDVQASAEVKRAEKVLPPRRPT